MKKNINYILGALAIITAAVLWSLDGTLIRPKFYEFSPINVVFLEHLFGTILLSPFLFFGWKKIKNINKNIIFSLLWVSLFGSLIGTLAITKAFFIAYAGGTTIATIVILQKLQPIFALIGAKFILKEQLTIKFYIWATIAIISAYILAFGSLGTNIFDINLLTLPAFYAILAAFGFGSSTVFGKSLTNTLGFKLTSSLRFLIATILAFIVLILFGNFLEYNTFSPIHYQLLLLIALTTGAGALFLYYFGLKRVKASESTIYELAWPISAIIFDYIFNKNILNLTQIIASLVLITCFFMIIKSNKNSSK